MSEVRDNQTNGRPSKIVQSDALRLWLKIGFLSFGGPAAQIALMHRLIVEEKKWLTEKQFLNALSFCMLLPGPEAMQLATYAGWRLHGVAGGLLAGLSFVIPGAVVVLVLAMIFAAFGQVPFVNALFLGIKAAVLVIVIQALLRMAQRALKRTEEWLIAGAAFVAIFFFALPFPLIIAAAALYGFVRPLPPASNPIDAEPLLSVNVAQTGRTIAVWAGLWIVPLAGLTAMFGSEHIFSQLGWFFSKLAVVTFGGAYAVLAYMGQDVVTHFGWLDAVQMMAGLGLAETTPGPLILVTEFVGYTAAYFHGAGPAMAAGLAGALIALWATFVPCFLWIFTGAPYITWICAQPRLRRALSTITAVVVGVILNLALWFALHVYFADVTRSEIGPLQLWIPHLATFDWRVLALSIVAGVLLLWRRWPIHWTLALSAALALTLSGDIWTSL